MIYGYARVSAKDQNLDRQVQELEKYGIEKSNIWKEKKSGKNFLERKVYNNLVKKYIFI